MTTPYELTSAKITKLQGPTDYPSWSTTLKFTLFGQGLWGVITGEDAAPNRYLDEAKASPNPTYPMHMAMERKAQSLLVLNVAADIQRTIKDLTTAKEMWNKLESTYQESGFNRKFLLLRSLSSFKLADYKSVNDYQLKFRALIQDLAEVDLTFGDDVKIAFFLFGLPAAYDSWVINKRTACRELVPPFDNIVNELIDEERLRPSKKALAAAAGGTKEKSEDKPAGSEGAGGGAKKRSASKKALGRGNGPNGACTHCERGGVHSEANCWTLHPDKRPERSQAGSNGGQGPGKSSGNSAGGRGSSTSGTKTTPEAADTSAGKQRYTDEHFAHPAALNTGVIRPRTNWCVDTGATDHVCNDLDAFTNYEPLDNVSLQGAFGRGGILGRGTVELPLALPDGPSVTATLSGVLYSPELFTNLLSVSAIEKEGFYFSSKDCFIRHIDDDSPIGFAPRSDGLFALELAPTGFVGAARSKLIRSSITDKESDARISISGGEIDETDDFRPYTVDTRAIALPTRRRRVSMTTWHRRLGHLGVGNLEKLARVASGIDIRGLSIPEGVCGACMKARQQRRPSRVPMTRATRVADLIHVDCIGPLTPMGFENSKWIVVFTDDRSRTRFAYTMRTKGDAQEQVRVFWRFIYAQADRKIKRIRMDNGTEFGGAAIKDWMTSNGIYYEPTVAYAPDQNGVAERSGGLLITRARAMLLDSGLDDTFWPEAVKCAEYLLNRSPTTAIRNGLLPWQMWLAELNGTAPEDERIDLSYLRQFGAIAHVHIPEERRQQGAKFQPRSERGYLVGYEAANIYRIWIPDRQRVIRARDVVFDEGPGIYEAPERTPTPDDANAQSQEYGGEQEATPELAAPSEETLEAAEPTPQRPLTPEDTIRVVPLPLAPPRAPPAAETLPRMPTPPVEGPEDDGISNDVHMEQDDDFLPPIPEEVNPRRTRRNRARPDRYGFEESAVFPAVLTAFSAVTKDRMGLDDLLDSEIVEPKTYAEALASPQAHHWTAAMGVENRHLLNKEVWQLEDLPPGHKALGGRWVYKLKRDAHGGILKYKARWVVKGYEQCYGRDYEETFAAVIKSPSYKVLFAMAAFYDLEVEQMDVVTAFLNSDLSELVYVEQPHGFVVPGQKGTRRVCRLRKALYGLKQSPRAWYHRIQEFLNKLGYFRIHSDHSIFTATGPKTDGVIIAVYVDDLQILGPTKASVQAVKDKLDEEFDMSDLGGCSHYLGMLITRNRASRALHLSQETYIRKVLDDFSFADSKPVSTPMEQGRSLEKSTEQADPAFIRQYQSAIGSLMYAMTQTRPDIAFAVSKLSQFAHNPDESHWTAVKRVFRYLQGTASMGITYGGFEHTPLGGVHHLSLQGYSDSDWGGCIDSRRSTTGYVFTVAGGAVSWSSKRQQTVALSSTEAEYMAVTQAAKEAIWLQRLLGELGYRDYDSHTVSIKTDNMGSMALTRNPEFHARMKHIDIRHHFIRDAEASGAIKLDYLTTELMTADGLTKPLSAVKFDTFIHLLRMGVGGRMGKELEVKKRGPITAVCYNCGHNTPKQLAC